MYIGTIQGGLRHFTKEGIVSNAHFWLMIYIPNHERQTFSIPFVVEKMLDLTSSSFGFR